MKKNIQLRVFASDPVTKGSVPGPRWELCIVVSSYRLGLGLVLRRLSSDYILFMYIR